ncbi:cysteine-rich KTR domain-containing protein [Candidatus Pseudoruminococcus sp.]
MDINNKAEWVLCPVCGNKTRVQICDDCLYRRG